METKIQGIVLNKRQYRDRDLISDLLLRSGRKISVIFYGGRGGGTKRKSSIVELGHLLSLELSRSGKKNSQLYSAKEWNLVWSAPHVRTNYQAFFLYCSYLELARQTSSDEDLYELRDDDHDEGIFRVLSNGLYYLDKSLGNNNFQAKNQLFIFLSKLIFELGLCPLLSECLFCQGDLLKVRSMSFHIDQAGFVCSNCGLEGVGDNNLLKALRSVVHMKYSDYKSLHQVTSAYNEILSRYLAHHLNLDQSKIQLCQASAL